MLILRHFRMCWPSSRPTLWRFCIGRRVELSCSAHMFLCRYTTRVCLLTTHLLCHFVLLILRGLLFFLFWCTGLWIFSFLFVIMVFLTLISLGYCFVYLILFGYLYVSDNCFVAVLCSFYAMDSSTSVDRMFSIDYRGSIKEPYVYSTFSVPF